MTATLKGVSASSVIPAGSTVRLVFGETHSFTQDAVFVPKFNDVVYQLPFKAGLFTISQSGALPGTTTATVDARTHADRTAAQTGAAVETLTGYFVELRSLELLSPAKAAEATKPAGALARDDAAAKAAEQAAADNPLTKFYHGLADTGRKVFVVALIVAFLVLLGYAGTLRKNLS